MSKHNERCKECKKRIFELLVNIYGENNVEQNYKLNFPNKIEEFGRNIFNSDLKEIFIKLEEYRSHNEFVRARKLPNVDFYVKDHFILEFDESQHFTKPRLIALEKYPEKLSLGFDKNNWMELCKKLDRKDNDPPFRDEQRAWYDTIRDFFPVFIKHKPTVRLYASDFEWCSLDATKREDLETFKKLIGE
jgi:hypothetical protein